MSIPVIVQILKIGTKRKSRVKQGSVNKAGQKANEINLALSEYENELDRYFLNLSVNNITPTSSDVRKKFNEFRDGYESAEDATLTKDENKELPEVMDEFMKVMGNLTTGHLQPMKNTEV